ncbi:hypothetical protein BCS42_05445 [Crenothrix sp. D3]|nr:hypothetical protein BCS42_05445 [Crenothrix sp. D3]
MKIHCSKKQRGSVVVVVTIALPILLLIMGLALDFAHVFVNKTRLQNALDATALSAAITINGATKKDKDKATSDGQDTFKKFIAASGNGELKNLKATDLTFEYSRKLKPWGSFDAKKDDFAFVRVTSKKNNLQLTPWLIRILSSVELKIPAVATAGPVGNNCELVPLVVCPKGEVKDDDDDDDEGEGEGEGDVQRGCDATGCNGIPFHKKVCLKGGVDAKKSGECQNPSLPSGNFGLLKFEGFNAGKDEKVMLAGTASTCTNNAEWKPGNSVGIVDAINDRFVTDIVKTEYKPPKYPYPDEGYNPVYDEDTKIELAKNTKGIAYRRIMAIPIVESCVASPPLKIIAAGCFLLTEKAIHNGQDNEIIGELTGICPGPGDFKATNSVLNGPYKIVLFKSPASGDS